MIYQIIRNVIFVLLINLTSEKFYHWKFSTAKFVPTSILNGEQDTLDGYIWHLQVIMTSYALPAAIIKVLS